MRIVCAVCLLLLMKLGICLALSAGEYASSDDSIPAHRAERVARSDSQASSDAWIPAVGESAELDDWRRTRYGWERMRDWPVAPDPASSIEPLRFAVVHPLVLAGIQLLLALQALLLPNRRPLPE